MPTFEIGLDDGRKLQIDADSQDAALAGVQHFLGQSSQPNTSGALSGLGDAVRQGAGNFVSGLGETGKRYFGAGQAAVDAGNNIAGSQPAGDTTLYDKDGIHWGNIPRYLAENAPGTAAALAAAKMAPGGLWGKALAAGVVGLGSMAGNYAKDATAQRTGDANAPSNAQDLTAGLVRAAPEAAIQSLPFGRIAAPVEGAAARVGMQGVMDAGKAAVGDAVSMGAANAGSNAYDQLNQTGTVDPTQAINAAAGGAVMGGALGAGRLPEAKAAIKYRGLAGEDPSHISEAANRIQNANDNLGGNVNNAQDGATAFKSAVSDVGTELKSTLASINAGDLSPESQAAIARAKQGIPLSDDDAARLQQDTGNTQAVQDLQRLAGVSRVLDAVKNTGYLHGDTFSGGASGALGSLAHNFAHSLGGGVLAAAGLGHFGLAMAPHSVAAFGGAYGAGRVLDALTGNRSAAGAFVNRFGNSDIVAPPVGSGQGQDQLDQMAQGAGPTGPKIARSPTQIASDLGSGPWDTSPTAAPQQPELPSFGKMQLAALRAKMKQTTGELNAPPPQPAQPELPQFNPIAMKMLKQQMANPPQAPQEPQAQPTQLPQFNPIAMKMLKQQMANPPQAPETTRPLKGGSGPIDIPQFLNSRAAPLEQPAPPASIEKTDGKVTVTPKASPDPTLDAVAGSKMQRDALARAIAKVKAPQVGEAFKDLVQPKAVTAAGQPTPIPDDLSIPDFLKRTPADAAEQKVTAAQAAQKLAAPPVIDHTPHQVHTPEELAMSPSDYANNTAANMNKFAVQRMKDTGKYDNFVKEVADRRTIKQQWSDALGKMFPDMADQIHAKLVGAHYRNDVANYRDALAAAYPDKAAAINSVLNKEALERVFTHAAPKGKKK